MRQASDRRRHGRLHDPTPSPVRLTVDHRNAICIERGQDFAIVVEKQGDSLVASVWLAETGIDNDPAYRIRLGDA